MSGNNKTVTISLSTPLFLLFLVLKLTNTIDWSWWWVTAPLWMPLVVFFGFMGIMLALAVIAAAASTRR